MGPRFRGDDEPGVDPVHLGTMLLNLGIALLTARGGGEALRLPCGWQGDDGARPCASLWAFYAVMFVVPIPVTYFPSIALWLALLLNM